MNLILLERSQLIEPQLAVLNSDQFEHLNNVLNARVGDEFNVGIIDGKIGKGIVTRLDPSQPLMQFTLDTEPPAKLPVSLYIALPRPKHIARILESVTSMGVKHIHFFQSYKVHKPFWSSELLSEDRLKRACRLGLEQSKDTIMPEVHFHRLFKPFVEDELPFLSSDGNKVVAHPYAEPYEPYEWTANKSAHIVFGPEGGLIDFELDLLSAQGFHISRFGDRVLKLETAVVSIVSRLTTPMMPC